MAASKNVRLCSLVADAVADEVRAMPVKDAARMLDTSLPMIRRLRAGTLSSVPILLKAIETFGVRILEPIIGPMDNASLARRLDAILADVGDLKHVVSSPTSLLVARPHGVAVTQDRAGEGEAGGDGQAGGHTVLGLALVQVRRSPAILAGATGAGLAEHLGANVVSLDAARNYARAHRNVGLAWKEPGLDWIVDPAADNRLWPGAVGPRPLARFPSPEHIPALRRGFEEAARSPEPILFEHTGFKDGEHIHALVGRRGSVANNGTEICMAAFEKRA